MEHQAFAWTKRFTHAFWDLMLRIKYPKLIILITTISVSFILFRNAGVQDFFESLGSLGYVSVFLGGMMFAFGFAAPFGVALLVTVAPSVNIYLAAVVGGLGALLSDYLLFRFVRVTFDDEIERLKESKGFKALEKSLVKRTSARFVHYLTIGIAGMIIASPLPDEFGVTMLSGMASVKGWTFALISYSLNTLGILFVLVLGAA